MEGVAQTRRARHRLSTFANVQVGPDTQRVRQRCTAQSVRSPWRSWPTDVPMWDVFRPGSGSPGRAGGPTLPGRPERRCSRRSRIVTFVQRRSFPRHPPWIGEVSRFGLPSDQAEALNDRLPERVLARHELTPGRREVARRRRSSVAVTTSRRWKRSSTESEPQPAKRNPAQCRRTEGATQGGRSGPPATSTAPRCPGVLGHPPRRLCRLPP
jgi:hypothetical protein